MRLVFNSHCTLNQIRLRGRYGYYMDISPPGPQAMSNFSSDNQAIKTPSNNEGRF